MKCNIHGLTHCFHSNLYSAQRFNSHIRRNWTGSVTSLSALQSETHFDDKLVSFLPATFVFSMPAYSLQVTLGLSPLVKRDAGPWTNQILVFFLFEESQKHFFFSVQVWPISVLQFLWCHHHVRFVWYQNSIYFYFFFCISVKLCLKITTRRRVMIKLN